MNEIVLHMGPQKLPGRHLVGHVDAVNMSGQAFPHEVRVFLGCEDSVGKREIVLTFGGPIEYRLRDLQKNYPY